MDDTEDITTEKIQMSIRDMKNNKAPGPGGIPIEISKDSLIQVIDVLGEICKRIQKKSINNYR